MNSATLGEYRVGRLPLTLAHNSTRGLVFKMMEKLEYGQITVHDSGKTFTFGHDSELQAQITVHSPSLYTKILLGGSIGAGEAYFEGLWDADNLTAVIRILVLNMELLERMEKGLALLLTPLRLVSHRIRNNSRNGAKRNILAHYDLGNDMYASFLDDAMMYSSAIYPSPESSLEEASKNKLDIICTKLQLHPGDHVIEIGTGWGGLAIHAARHFGCRVTTTTISREQYDYACRQVQQAGLTVRIDVLMRDYRDLDGRYDKLVSVEMIEAVGHHYLDRYLATIDGLLKPDGLALVQAITIEDFRYQSALKSVDFIKRYIFPGSFIPSLSAITASMARATRLGLIELADFGASYALTLRHWRQRFDAAWDDISATGFDETFRRRWQFYLAYCEGGFRERAISDVHLLLAGPGFRPMRTTGLTGVHA